MTSFVAVSPVPAMTGILPFTWSTQASMTSALSGWDIKENSPVVPQGTMPVIPLSMSQSMRLL